MALTAGSKVLYSDFESVKTAVDAAYTTTKRTAPSWTNAPAVGQKLTYTTLSQLDSFGAAANRALVTVRNSTHYSSHGTGGETGRYVQFNTNKSTYYTGNNKCGGVITYGMDFYSSRSGRFFGPGR